MLIRFSVENFLSFREETEFSMIPGRARKHPNHLIKDEAWNGINLLKGAVIYGANASGKSNFVKALEFCRELIVEGTHARRQISVPVFRFDEACKERPATFKIEIKVRDDYYAYGFEVLPDRIVSEWLYAITKTTNKVIFERTTVEGQTQVEFGSIDFEDREEEKFLQFVGRGTRPNKLFLSESIERGVKRFERVFNWFDRTLVIVFPESQFVDLETSIRDNELFRSSIEHLLKSFNTGIARLGLQQIQYDADLELPKDFRSSIEADLDTGQQVIVRGPDRRRFMFEKAEDGTYVASELVAEHDVKGKSNREPLEFAYESDGTQRLLDLIPGFLSLINDQRVLVIDELDRSLHPALSYALIELFLDGTADQASQLVATTHETGLLDLDLLRRDEIWFVEKNGEGATSMYSLEEFTPRYDRDIRKGYLLGRFGAIPVVHDVGDLEWAKGDAS